jgi:hypothetical protein
MTTLRMQVSANSLIQRTERFFEKLALVIEHVDSTRLPMADFDKCETTTVAARNMDTSGARPPACVRCMLLAATTSCSR